MVNNYPAMTGRSTTASAKMGDCDSVGFFFAVARRRPVQVQALVDATDDNTANVLIGYAQAVVQGYSAEVQINWLRRAGQSMQPAGGERADAHLVQRGSRKQRVHHSGRAGAGDVGDWRVPDFADHCARVGARHDGAVDLNAGDAMEIMLGKLAPYFVLGMFDVIVCAVIAIYWFHVPFRGSYVTLAGQLRNVHGGGAFAGILHFRAGEEPVRGQPDRAADYVSSGVSAVGISVFDRADAGRAAMDHADSSGSLLRFGAEEDLSQRNTNRDALCGLDSPLRVRIGAGDGGNNSIPQEAGLKENAMFGRLKQMMIKEFIQVFRDKRTRFMLFGPPIIQMMVFGYAANYEIHHVPTVVLDLDHSQESRDLVSRFTSSPYFDVQRQLTDSRQIRDLIDRGHATVGMEIDAGFAQKLRGGQTAPMQVIVDATNSNTALIASGYISQIALGFARDYQKDRIYRIAPQLMEVMPSVELEPRPWYNPDLTQPLVFCAGNHRQPDAGTGDYADGLCGGARAGDWHAGADHGHADPPGGIHSWQDAAVFSDRPLRCDADCGGRNAVVSSAISRPCFGAVHGRGACSCCACWAWGC